MLFAGVELPAFWAAFWSKEKLLPNEGGLLVETPAPKIPAPGVAVEPAVLPGAVPPNILLPLPGFAVDDPNNGADPEVVVEPNKDGPPVEAGAPKENGLAFAVVVLPKRPEV